MTMTLGEPWESYRFNEEAFVRKIYLLLHYNHRTTRLGVCLVRQQVKSPNYVLAINSINFFTPSFTYVLYKITL